MVPTCTTWVHPFNQSYDHLQSGSFKVFAICHSSAYFSKQLEVLLLSGQQRVRRKMRDDSRKQDAEASHLPFQRLVASVWPNGSGAEVLLHQQEDFRPVAILADRQARSDLPANQNRWPGRDRDCETSSPSTYPERYDGRSIAPRKEPAYCPGHRFATPPTLSRGCDRAEASPRRDQSLRGHTVLDCTAEGFPRHYPPAIVSSLIETAG
jgi:hypothetical protein